MQWLQYLRISRYMRIVFCIEQQVEQDSVFENEQAKGKEAKQAAERAGFLLSGVELDLENINTSTFALFRKMREKKKNRVFGVIVVLAEFS